MWKANHDAMHAGFGHHRAPHGERRLPTIESPTPKPASPPSTPVRPTSNSDWTRSKRKHGTSTTLPIRHRPEFGLEDLHREQLHEIDQMLDAFEVWTTWASGHPVAVADLTNAAEIFADSARRASVLSGSPGEIDRSRWMELLEPILQLLDQRGVDAFHRHAEP